MNTIALLKMNNHKPILSIQLSKPGIKSEKKANFLNVYDVLTQRLCHSKERMFLYWHKIPVSFSYSNDLARNFDALLSMTWLIQKEQKGATKVDFTTQILFIHWEIFWNNDNLLIKSKFEEKQDAYEPYANALNSVSELEISKTTFLSEWKTLLHQIIEVFEQTNIEIEDGKERRKWELLKTVEAQIPQYGIMYEG